MTVNDNTEKIAAGGFVPEGDRANALYKFVLNIDEQTFDQLSESGILRANAKRDLQIYGFYLEHTRQSGSMQAIHNAAEKYHLSEDQAKRIIYRIKKLKFMPVSSVIN